MRKYPRLADAAWSIVTQVASSASNFLAALLFARSMGLADFGRVMLVVLTFTIATQFARTTTSQVLLLTTGDETPAAGYRGCSLLITVVSMVVGLVIALTTLRDVWLIVLLILGGGCVVFQDSLRFARIASGDWQRTASSDAARLIVTVCGFCAVILSDGDARLAASVWAAGALASVLVLRSGVSAEDMKQSVAWARFHRSRLLPLLSEASVLILAGYAVNWIVLALAGFGGLGILRSAQVLMSPIVTIAQAVVIILLKDGPRERNGRLVAIGASAFLILLTTIWTLFLLVPGVGASVLGNNWSAARHSLFYIGLAQVLSNITLVITAKLKVDPGPRASLQLRFLTLWCDPTMVALLTVAAGAEGAVIGLAVSQGLVAAIALVYHPWAVRRHQRRGAPRAS